MKRTDSRRSFLRQSAASAFGFSVLPSYLALGKEDSDGNLPPSKRINLGCVGVGNRASIVIPAMCGSKLAVPVAFCDVDFKAPRIDGNLRAYPDIRRFADFREMLDKMGDDIDAVTVCTPDHTHFVAAMDAMRRGKHVYVEKPLAHSFDECEMLMKAEKKFGVVTQMGNQGHTSGPAAQFKQMVEKGLLRNVRKIEAWKTPFLAFQYANWRISDYPAAQPIPESLDWDLWCGPAEKKPFSSRYHPFQWRAFYLYGNGMFGDWGAHIVNFAHDYLNLGLPSKIRAIKLEDHNKVIFPLVTQIAMHFPARGDGMPACDFTWREGNGCEPELDEKYWNVQDDGTKKQPAFGVAGMLVYPDGADFAVKCGSHAEASTLYPNVKNKEHVDAMKVPNVNIDHTTSFLRACMGEGETTSPFRISAPLCQVFSLGVICQYLNPEEVLEFDPEQKRFTNSTAGNDLLKGPAPRKGWEEFYGVV